MCPFLSLFAYDIFKFIFMGLPRINLNDAGLQLTPSSVISWDETNRITFESEVVVDEETNEETVVQSINTTLVGKYIPCRQRCSVSREVFISTKEPKFISETQTIQIHV